jgi:hypothetical protein
MLGRWMRAGGVLLQSATWMFSLLMAAGCSVQHFQLYGSLPMRRARSPCVHPVRIAVAMGVYKDSTHLLSLAKADSAPSRSSLFHHPCRIVSSSSGERRREALCGGLGSRRFTERFHRNALVTHFQHHQVFCPARRLENYVITRCRLHQRAPQR